MKKLACVLFILCCATASLGQTRYGAYSTLHLSFDVVTPDGVTLPAGDYSVNVPHRLRLLPAGRPSASMGRWAGPQIRLSREGEGPASRAFWLTTAVEVRVVYDLPGDSAERRQARSSADEVAPLIRNRRELVGIIYRGDTLYITETATTPRKLFFRR